MQDTNRSGGDSTGVITIINIVRVGLFLLQFSLDHRGRGLSTQSDIAGLGYTHASRRCFYKLKSLDWVWGKGVG